MPPTKTRTKHGGRRIVGDLRGDGLRVAVLVARWNAAITDRLLEGALATLDRAGVHEGDVSVVEVPGSYELPQAALRVAKSGRVDAVVALGCVIRGETPHHEHVARECARGCLDVALSTGVPVTFGVITADTPAQAEARSRPAQDTAAGSGAVKGGHKGVEAAEAAVRLAAALKAWDASARPGEVRR